MKTGQRRKGCVVFVCVCGGGGGILVEGGKLDEQGRILGTRGAGGGGGRARERVCVCDRIMWGQGAASSRLCTGHLV